jgi:peptide/nickel transport system permease protein
VLRYIARRLLLSLPVLIGALTLTFVATVSAPGDPLAGLLPDNPTAEQRAQIAREFGLDASLPEQWLRFMGRITHGDLGRSLRTRNPVAQDLAQAAVATFELALVAFVISAFVGVLIGVNSARREGRWPDHLMTLLSLGGVAAPIFWTALMLQLLFYDRLHLFPAGGRMDDITAFLNPFPRRTGLMLVDTAIAANPPAFWSAVTHLVLPAGVLAYRAIGLVSRVARVAMSDVLHAPYMRTARAFGATERRLAWRHGLRNAMLPILTVLGLTFGELVAGSILVESVFNWPGLGRYTLDSIATKDYPGIMGVTLVITVAYLFGNLVIDVLYPLVDPRLRRAS